MNSLAFILVIATFSAAAEMQPLFRSGSSVVTTPDTSVVQMDTVRTVSISGEDTTVAVTISPSLGETKKNVDSMAGSLRFIAVITGITFVASVVSLIFTIISINKEG